MYDDLTQGDPQVAHESALLQEAEEQLSALASRWRHEEKERGIAQSILDFAGGDQLRHLPRSPYESLEHFTRKIKYSPNLLGWAANSMALLYDEEPIRSVQGGDEEAQKKWADISWKYGRKGGLSKALRKADRLSLLTGTALVWRCFSVSQTGPKAIHKTLQDKKIPTEGAGIQAVVLPRPRFTLLPDKNDPEWIDAVLVHISTRKEGRGRGNVIHTFHFWNDRVHGVVERRGQVGTGWGFCPMEAEGETKVLWEHGYGRHPFVPVHYQQPDFGVYSRGWGGADLLPNFKALARVWSELAHTAALQRGQPYFIGPGDPENDVLGPYALFKADAGTFGIADNKANLTGIRETLSDMIHTQALVLDVPSRVFRWEANEAMSGVAIVADRAESEDWRKRRAGDLKPVEAEIETLDRLIWPQHTGDFLTPYTTAYRDWTPPKSNTEKRAQADKELLEGFITPADYLADTRPELSDTQRADRLKAAAEYHAAETQGEE